MQEIKLAEIKSAQCPKCQKRLQEVAYFGEMIDKCKKCQGMWFDSNELDRLKSQMDESIRWIDIDLWKFANRANFKASEFDCPKCQSVMSELTFENSHTNLEFCINCSGVWLDRGELNTMIKFIQEKTAEQPLGELGKASLQQLKEIFGGPKGLLAESKDFIAAWQMVTTKFAVTHPRLAEKIRIARSSIPF